MGTVEFQLIQIEGFTYVKCPEIYDSLNTPLQINYIEQELKKYNLYDKRLLELYSWKDGNIFQGSDSPFFCSWGHFFSLNRAIDLFNQKDYYDVFKSPSFFPIIGHGGDFLLIKLGVKRKEVFIYSPSLLINEPISIFNTFGSFLSGVSHCFEHGIYGINEKGVFESDLVKEESFFRENNFKMQFWG